MVCQRCIICDKNKCPKEGKGKPSEIKYIPISNSMMKKLEQLCKKQNFLNGPEYYPVPDYNKAIDFLYRNANKQPE